MGWLSRLLGREAKSYTTLDLFREVFGGLTSNTGREVNVATALEVTTVLRCAGVIADGVATVPLKLLRREANGARVEVQDHPLHEVLTVQPNEWQDSLEFRETLTFHLVLTGNAFCFINRVRGRVVELIPIEPRLVQVKRATDYTLTYEVTPHLTGEREVLPADAIWHLRGPSWNGWMGLEAVKLAREAIGLSLATEEAHARLHKNGIRSSGAWSVEGTLDEAQYKRLSAWLKQAYAGLQNTGVPLVMDRAAKWQATAMSGVDAQHVETRRLQIEEICRAFGVMPIMVGFSDKASTYASAEQMFLAHAVHTVRPWHRRFEASIRRNLLTEEERRGGLYPKFFDTELLRGAARDRGEFYARALGSGGGTPWMEVNEVRGFEDMDQVAWGEGRPQPANAPKAPAGGADEAAGGGPGQG